MAPSVVNASVKTAIFTAYMLEKLGFEVKPRYNEKRADIVEAIIFNNPDKLVKYCRGIQMASAIDSYVRPIPDDMPGYGDKVIMAAGPFRKPYIAYQQGALTFEYGKLGVMKAITEIRK